MATGLANDTAGSGRKHSDQMRRAWFHYSCFLGRYLLYCRTEYLDMIQTYLGGNGENGLKHVGRVEPPAEACLDDGNVGL